MDNPPGSVLAQRRTTLVAFLVLLISVLVITVLMVLPYVHRIGKFIFRFPETPTTQG